MVFADIFMLLFYFCTIGVDVQNDSILSEQGGFTGGMLNKKTRAPKSFVMFELLTDWVLILLFVYKIFHAIKYALSLQYRGKKDDEFLIAENGE